MVQDPNNMNFCENCKMNVYPSRPKFNLRLFGVYTIIMILIFTFMTLISYSVYSEVFIIIYFMWGFMIFNPYLLYYGLQKKHYCPRCFTVTVEKNLEYKPFGDKLSEIYKNLALSEISTMKWYCPYCGTLIRGNFCKSCGKKFELNTRSKT